MRTVTAAQIEETSKSRMHGEYGNGTTNHTTEVGKNNEDGKLPIFIATQTNPFLGSGRNYMKYTPLSSKATIGTRVEKFQYDVLNDMCSNITLMDIDLFKMNYPEFDIKTNQVNIIGISLASTLGHCRVPIWMEGYNVAIGMKYLIKMVVEVHLRNNFAHSLLLGMDTLQDYSIEFSLSEGMANVGEFRYEINHARTRFRTVLVRSKNDITIYRRMCIYTPIMSHMIDGIDYIFQPW